MMCNKLKFKLIFGVLIALSLAILGCSNISPITAATPPPTAMNLIFVVTPDLSNNNGDINTTTANLTNQGFQRALKLGTWLQTVLLNSANVNGIYALEPVTHLQTDENYPDMVPLEIIEQFAVLNQYAENSIPASSFPVGVSYSQDSVPPGAPAPLSFPANCQGIDFADNNGDNEKLVNDILSQKSGGYYVFAMPFDTFKLLLNNLKSLNSYGYTVPVAPEGPNIVYVINIPFNGSATLTKYDTKITPGATYPAITPLWQDSPSNYQTPFTIQTSQAFNSSPPGDINKNETVYFIRHGEAHPASGWEDGNLILQGDWRALYLPTALAGKINTPDFVYGPDPAQLVPGVTDTFSYVRPSLTVAPYAIANGIPFYVANTFLYSAPGITIESQAQASLQTAKFFFTGGQFTNKTLLISWEHNHIPIIAQQLVNLYFESVSDAPIVPPPPNSWPSNDYDTIWTFSLDGNGNLTLSNLTCEGINSANLPTTPPALSF